MCDISRNLQLDVAGLIPNRTQHLLRMVHGHLTTRACDVSGGAPTFGTARRPCSFMAVVRHPIDKLISSYNYIASAQSGSTERQAAALTQRYPAVLDMLAAVVAEDSPCVTGPTLMPAFGAECPGLALRFISAAGDARREPPRAATTLAATIHADTTAPFPASQQAASLRDALHMLSHHYSHLGVTDRFDELQGLLAAQHATHFPLHCGKQRESQPRLGEAGLRVRSRHDLAGPLLAKLEAAFAAEIELWRFASQLMSERNAAAANFDASMQVLRRKCMQQQRRLHLGF
jgi:hypothetical protein